MAQGKEKKQKTLLNRLPIFALLFVPLFLTLIIGIGLIFVVDIREATEREKAAVFARDNVFAHAVARSVELHLDNSIERVELYAENLATHGDFDDPSSLTRIAEQFAAQSASFYRFSVVDLEGMVIADYFPAGATLHEREAGVGIDVTQRDYWQRVNAQEKTVQSDVLSSLATGLPISLLITPVRVDGEIVGFALATLNFEPIAEIASLALGTEQAQAIILDSSGNVVVHPNPAFVETSHNLINAEPAQRARIAQMGTIEAYTAADGNEYIASFQHIPKYDWTVWVRQSTDQFARISMDVLRRELAQSLFFFFLATCTLFGISWIGSMTLRRFKYATQRTTEGTWEHMEEKWYNPKEMTDLVKNYNAMVDTLKKRAQSRKELTEMKSRFLQIISHVFRTPLNVLSWNTNSLAKKVKQFKKTTRTACEEEVNAIQASTERMNITFHNIFDALEIQEKTIRANLQPTSLTELVEDVVSTLRKTVPGTHIAIKTELDDIPDAYVDRQEIEHTISNIIHNAIMYQKPDVAGKINIQLTKHKDNAVIIVKDNGIGIAKNEQQKLFEPFSRGEDAGTYHPDGVGLGMFIAKSYVELHHGTITLDSAPGKGTTVEIRLPIHPKLADISPSGKKAK